jgi:hypothetical protein
MTKQGETVEQFDFIPQQFRFMFTPSMFPPTPEEAEKFNLHLW